MNEQTIQNLLQKQKAFFASGKTRSISFRVEQLKKLKKALKDHEQKLLAALKTDLNKSDFEGYTSEVGFVYEEINDTLRHIEEWSAPQFVSTPLLHQPAESWIYPQPRGVALIIGPWNYPMQLVIAPLVGAIAAGNCAILKPSEISQATCHAVKKLIEDAFPPEFCAVVDGGVPETTALLKQPFDKIFFTGSTEVGRIVMRAAAEHLTPVTLELGGKSPCIVDESVNIKVAARRITWGKFYNAGQTCVAPDYLLVQKNIKTDFLAAMKDCVHEFFGADPEQSPDYGRIISDRHFQRLTGLMGKDKIIFGGKTNAATRYMSPTAVEATPAHPSMREEIFGPVFPVMEYTTSDEAIALVNQHPNPLACYVFSKNKKFSDRVLEEIPFGGGCVNNTLIHLANPGLPFGGVGASGMGAYHGQSTFNVFSHMKSVIKSPFAIDIKVKYPPYKKKLGLLRFLMR